MTQYHLLVHLNQVKLVLFESLVARFHQILSFLCLLNTEISIGELLCHGLFHLFQLFVLPEKLRITGSFDFLLQEHDPCFKLLNSLLLGAIRLTEAL